MTTREGGNPIRRVLVTGASGNLGRRLLPLLAGYELVLVDLFPRQEGGPAGKFVQLDLSESEGQQALGRLLDEEQIEAVVHLAFVIDPVQTGITNTERMWRANVQATKELLRAVGRVNGAGTPVRLVIFPSSVSAYGPDLPPFVEEDAPLQAHTLAYAVHKRECDEICQRMFGELGGAALYVYRPHIFVGRTVDNYILRALRGRPSGRGWVAKAVERLGLRVPIVLPWSSKGENLFQFVHVDDVARVLAWTVRHFRSGELKILNLCAPGEPLTLAECARMARTPIVRLAGLKVVDNLLGVLWAMGLSGVPAGSMPYFLGSYTMSTKRLREELGEDFEELIRFTSREGLEDALSRE